MGLVDKLVTLDGLRYFRQRMSAASAPKSHASSSAAEYGAASASAYGHAKATSTVPKPSGAAALGSETSSFARGDHVHPTKLATSSAAGAVKPDNGTTTVAPDGTLRAVPPSAQSMFLAAHPVGSYMETDGSSPSSSGGTWERQPSMGPYLWLRTK